MNASRGWEIYPQIIFDMAMRIKMTIATSRGSWRRAGWGWKTKASSVTAKASSMTATAFVLSANICGTPCAPARQGPTAEGYMLWAFTDNVSPMNAFKNRYGLIEIDLQNHRARRPKASAHWFRQLGERRELVLDIDDEYR